MRLRLCRELTGTTYVEEDIIVVTQRFRLGHPPFGDVYASVKSDVDDGGGCPRLNMGVIPEFTSMSPRIEAYFWPHFGVGPDVLSG